MYVMHLTVTTWCCSGWWAPPSCDPCSQWQCTVSWQEGTWEGLQPRAVLVVSGEQSGWGLPVMECRLGQGLPGTFCRCPQQRHRFGWGERWEQSEDTWWYSCVEEDILARLQLLERSPSVCKSVTLGSIAGLSGGHSDTSGISL